MNIYYQVFEYFPTSEGEGKRLIHAFETFEAANGLIDYLYRHDHIESSFGMEEYEAPTKL